MRTTSYRVPGEHLVLLVTLTAVAAVVALTAAATVCGSAVFVALFVVMSYSATRSHHRQLLAAARHVTAQTYPQLARLILAVEKRLRPGTVDVFIVPSRTLNAYTFGLDSPKGLVLFSSMLQVMDDDELAFVVGHEMGHVALGHTWLNSLIGGLSGIPSSFGAAAVLRLAFLSWNRMCELSADRAGLLACGQPEKAVSALIKLEAGDVPGGRTFSERDLAEAYRRVDAEDDTMAGSLGEALMSHPMLIRRINAIREYAASSQYQRLVAAMGSPARAV